MNNQEALFRGKQVLDIGCNIGDIYIKYIYFIRDAPDSWGSKKAGYDIRPNLQPRVLETYFYLFTVIRTEKKIGVCEEKKCYDEFFGPYSKLFLKMKQIPIFIT